MIVEADIDQAVPQLRQKGHVPSHLEHPPANRNEHARSRLPNLATSERRYRLGGVWRASAPGLESCVCGLRVQTRVRQ